MVLSSVEPKFTPGDKVVVTIDRGNGSSGRAYTGTVLSVSPASHIYGQSWPASSGLYSYSIRMNFSIICPNWNVAEYELTASVVQQLVDWVKGEGDVSSV